MLSPSPERTDTPGTAGAPAPDGRRLDVLYDEIGERARAITGAHPWWPCRKGCDRCCRALAAPPAVTRLEWERLWEGFAALDPAVQAQVRERVSGLARAWASSPRPSACTCPLLDPEAGACLVYDHRPAICRTYGFYVERREGNWCSEIEGEVVAREELVQWGNQPLVDAALARLSGAPLSIFDWFAGHPA